MKSKSSSESKSKLVLDNCIDNKERYDNFMKALKEIRKNLNGKEKGDLNQDEKQANSENATSNEIKKGNNSDESQKETKKKFSSIY